LFLKAEPPPSVYLPRRDLQKTKRHTAISSLAASSLVCNSLLEALNCSWRISYGPLIGYQAPLPACGANARRGPLGPDPRRSRRDCLCPPCCCQRHDCQQQHRGACPPCCGAAQQGQHRTSLNAYLLVLLTLRLLHACQASSGRASKPEQSND
jgi:hypothetical protein